MGLAGTVLIRVVPMAVTIPFGLEGIGEGGTKTQPWGYDFAGFTTGSAFVATNQLGTTVKATMVGGPTLTVDGGPGVALVSPTFFFAGGSQLPLHATLIVPVPPGTEHAVADRRRSDRALVRTTPLVSLLP